MLNLHFILLSSCKCLPGYTGPRCQATTRSFRGNGWAWLPPLQVCEKSHLSVEFATRKGDGLLLYNGPIVAPEPEEILVSGNDFFFCLIYNSV